uniref:Uncharacterized protein n=1 Tax=Arundo donax TaxID=35708 RepID=A0A0A9HLA7_ARUDO
MTTSSSNCTSNNAVMVSSFALALIR